MGGCWGILCALFLCTPWVVDHHHALTQVEQAHRRDGLITLDPFASASKRVVTLRTCNLKRIHVRVYRVQPHWWPAFCDYRNDLVQMNYRYIQDKNTAWPMPPGDLVDDRVIDVGGSGSAQGYRPDHLVTTRLPVDSLLQTAVAGHQKNASVASSVSLSGLSFGGFADDDDKDKSKDAKKQDSSKDKKDQPVFGHVVLQIEAVKADLTSEDTRCVYAPSYPAVLFCSHFAFDMFFSIVWFCAAITRARLLPTCGCNRQPWDWWWPRHPRRQVSRRQYIECTTLTCNGRCLLGSMCGFDDGRTCARCHGGIRQGAEAVAAGGVCWSRCMP